MTSTGARITTVLPIILLGSLLWDAAHRTAWDAPREVGFALAAVVFLLLAIARFQLGDSFSIAPEARRLVTTGLYSKIRNPVYVFGALAIAGGFLYMHLYTGLLFFLIVVPMQVARARAEARVLEAKFGDQYRAYRAQTWF